MKTFRQAQSSDLPVLLELYSHAREFMKRNGNPDQWKDSRPSQTAIEKDIEEGCLYLVIDDGKPAGAFSLLLGTDPTYLYIEEGQWLSDRPYGAIHKIAAWPGASGVFDAILSFCQARTSSLRIDTHPDNAIMRHLIAKAGFLYCGHIFTDDHTMRLAYQKDLDKTGQHAL